MDFNLNIRKQSMSVFIILNIITLGIYIYFWLFKLIEDLNAVILDENKKISFWKFASIPIFFDIVNIFLLVMGIDNDFVKIWDNLSRFISCTCFMIISFSLLKTLESIALKKYNKKLDYLIGYIWIFSVFYVNFIINNFSQKLKANQN